MGAWLEGMEKILHRAVERLKGYNQTHYKEESPAYWTWTCQRRGLGVLEAVMHLVAWSGEPEVEGQELGLEIELKLVKGL